MAIEAGKQYLNDQPKYDYFPKDPVIPERHYDYRVPYHD